MEIAIRTKALAFLKLIDSWYMTIEATVGIPADKFTINQLVAICPYLIPSWKAKIATAAQTPKMTAIQPIASGVLTFSCLINLLSTISNTQKQKKKTPS